MADKHMGVAEVKRRFADVVDEVMHGGRRIIVERRGQPVPPQHLGRLHRRLGRGPAPLGR